VRLWEYVKKCLIDAKYGGWFVAGLDTNPNARKQPKANSWKDSSHEVEALLDSLLMLDSFLSAQRVLFDLRSLPGSQRNATFSNRSAGAPGRND